MNEKFILMWEQYRDAIEHRLETEQFFVATVYVFSTLIAGIVLLCASLRLLLALGPVMYFGTFGAVMFYGIYRILKQATLEDEDNTNDDDEPPIGI